jgi:hypothetical protein
MEIAPIRIGAFTLPGPAALAPMSGVTDHGFRLAAHRFGAGKGCATLIVGPIILGVLSFKTTQIKAMQSATGLLYIAMGAVFAGEVLAKGLMFLTGRPV